MKLTSWGDDDGFHVEGLSVVLGEHEHLTAYLPSGHRVDIFADHIRVAEPGTPRTSDGKRIWPPPKPR